MTDDNDDLPEIRHRWTQRALSTGRIAGHAARLAGRRLFRAEAGQRDADIAASLARELDGMKGLAMKVGQIISYFDGILPEGSHAALRTLQQGARAVAFEKMTGVVEDAFGAGVDELFDDFEREPVAAASIGQVHRARFDGRRVAVKIQYPNVAKTFTSDFGRIRRLARLASLATAVDGVAIADELRERIMEETDYEQEATWQKRFRAAWRHDPEIVIPAVVDARTRRTVLTTEWHDGRDFYAFAQDAEREHKNRTGLRLARFAWHCFFRLRTLNADPHPGNYLFPDPQAAPASSSTASSASSESSGQARRDPPTVFLDFGCIRRFDEDFVESHRRLARVVVDGDRSAFRDAVLATEMVPRPHKFDFEAHWEMMRHAWQPYIEPSFRFTSAWVRAGAEFTGPSNPNLRRLAIPPAWIWLQRLQWGLHAVLARLEAEGPFRDVLENALED